MNVVACNTCGPFSRKVVISSPDELWEAIAEIRAEILAGHLLLRGPARQREACAAANEVPFFSLERGQSLPDYLSYAFSCTDCGKAYELTCETYHGTGGTWSEVKGGFDVT